MIKIDYKINIVRTMLIAMILLSFTCFYVAQNYKSNGSAAQTFQIANMDSKQESKNSNTTNQNQNNMQNGDGNMKPPGDGNNQPPGGGGQPGDNQNQPHGQPGGGMPGGGADSKYFKTINIYGGIFLALSLSMYYLFKRKKIEFNLKNEKIVIVTILTVGIILRIACSTLIEGFNGDISLFKNWAETAANGFTEFYANARQADYPPLYIYVLSIVGKLASISFLNSYFVLLLKLPSIIADVITAYYIYKLGKKYLKSSIGMLLSLFYAFNPAVFIDSTFWGQVDSFFTLLVVIALCSLSEKKYILSSAMFTIGILMKPQGIIYIPILFFELVRQRKLKNFIYSAISALIIGLIIIIPFSLNQQNFLWIIDLYTKTISEYPYASVNAYNFFYLIGGNYKDYNANLFLVNYHTLGMIFIVLTTLLGWFVYIKRNDRKYVSAIALLQIAGVFTFSVGMHERYLFPAVALAVLACIYLKDSRFFLMAIGFSITSYINIATVLFSSHDSNLNSLITATSVFNILLVIYLLKVLVVDVFKQFSFRVRKEEIKSL